jgi:hypothetical protein
LEGDARSLAPVRNKKDLERNLPIHVHIHTFTTLSYLTMWIEMCVTKREKERQAESTEKDRFCEFLCGFSLFILKEIKQ